MIKRYLAGILATNLILVYICIPTFAASPDMSEKTYVAEMTITSPDGVTAKYTFNGAEMGWVVCDENGTPVMNSLQRITYTNIELKNGWSYWFGNESLDRFKLVEGTKISFTATFTSKASFEMGYMEFYDAEEVPVFTTTSSISSHTETFIIPKDGEYTFYIRNNSTDTKTLSYVEIVDI